MPKIVLADLIDGPFQTYQIEESRDLDAAITDALEPWTQRGDHVFRRTCEDGFTIWEILTSTNEATDTYAYTEES